MDNQFRPRKRSIRIRILLIMLIFIITIFLVILTVFNILVREHIRSSVNEQLREVMQIVSTERDNTRQFPLVDTATMDQRFGLIPDMRMLSRGTLGTPEAIIISERYDILFPDENMLFMRNYDEINTLVDQMKSDLVKLGNSDIVRLTAHAREYYLVSLEIPLSGLDNMVYLVYYVDMTAITTFANRINTVLVVVMGASGLLAILIATFLSGLIAKPIKDLTHFAARIGQGDFTRSKMNYKDAELAELAESMNSAAIQLETFDKDQKTFFQNVSHELRTPLQTIRCRAEGINHGILYIGQSSQIIISETDKLSEMVEDLLYLSRIDSLPETIENNECDLRECVSNCVERQRTLAAERGVRFLFDFSEQPTLILCNEKHMSRAFANLISNAVRYAKSTIRLSCKQTDGRIIITVSDDGRGISKEDLPHVFDRFYKGKDGNHGIGLSIVKTVVEQYNGQIKIQSTSKGTSFIITF